MVATGSVAPLAPPSPRVPYGQMRTDDNVRQRVFCRALVSGRRRGPSSPRSSATSSGALCYVSVSPMADISRKSKGRKVDRYWEALGRQSLLCSRLERSGGIVVLLRGCKNARPPSPFPPPPWLTTPGVACPLIPPPPSTSSAFVRQTIDLSRTDGRAQKVDEKWRGPRLRRRRPRALT